MLWERIVDGVGARVSTKKRRAKARQARILEGRWGIVVLLRIFGGAMGLFGAWVRGWLGG